MLDQLRQLAIFAKTVDHGSFKAAARSLGLSPSVVSHHVSQLEEKLGVALLYRSTRKLALTPDGERLLQSARIMVEAAEDGMAAMSETAGQASGELRVTVPSVLAQSVLVDRIAAFATLHPKVRLTLDFSDLRRDLIADGFDVAIRMGWLKDSSLISRKLHGVRRVLVASSVLLRDRPAPLEPRELDDWEWLALTQVSASRTTFRKPGREPVSIRPDARIASNDARALYQLARSGAGLAVIPVYLAAADIEAGLVAHLLADWEPDPIAVYALWPPNAPRDGLTRLFVDALAR